MPLGGEDSNGLSSDIKVELELSREVSRGLRRGPVVRLTVSLGVSLGSGAGGWVLNGPPRFTVWAVALVALGYFARTARQVIGWWFDEQNQIAFGRREDDDVERLDEIGHERRFRDLLDRVAEGMLSPEEARQELLELECERMARYRGEDLGLVLLGLEGVAYEVKCVAGQLKTRIKPGVRRDAQLHGDELMAPFARKSWPSGFRMGGKLYQLRAVAESPFSMVDKRNLEQATSRYKSLEMTIRSSATPSSSRPSNGDGQIEEE